MDKDLLRRLQSWLIFLAAILFVIGSATGGLVSLAMTQGIPLEPGSTLAAHLNAYLGTFWMICVAWTLPRCRLNTKALKVLVVFVTAANFGNWAITLLKSGLHVRGLAFSGEPKNDAVLVLLLVCVVAPAFGASLLWAWGLRPPFGETQEPPATPDV